MALLHVGHTAHSASTRRGSSADGDGWSDLLDCDDADPTAFPAATTAADGHDTDCNCITECSTRNVAPQSPAAPQLVSDTQAPLDDLDDYRRMCLVEHASGWCDVR